MRILLRSSRELGLVIFFFLLDAHRHLNVFVHVRAVPAEARAGIGSAGAGLVGSCQPSGGY